MPQVRPRSARAGLQFYRSGVWDPAYCSKTETDHAVQVVGYGVDGTETYWIVRNRYACVARCCLPLTPCLQLGRDLGTYVHALSTLTSFLHLGRQGLLPPGTWRECLRHQHGRHLSKAAGVAIAIPRHNSSKRKMPVTTMGACAVMILCCCPRAAAPTATGGTSAGVWVAVAIGAWLGVMVLLLAGRWLIRLRWPHCPADCSRYIRDMDCRACDMLTLAQCLEGGWHACYFVEGCRIVIISFFS